MYEAMVWHSWKQLGTLLVPTVLPPDVLPCPSETHCTICPCFWRKHFYTPYIVKSAHGTLRDIEPWHYTATHWLKNLGCFLSLSLSLKCSVHARTDATTDHVVTVRTYEVQCACGYKGRNSDWINVMMRLRQGCSYNVVLAVQLRVT